MGNVTAYSSNTGSIAEKILSIDLGTSRVKVAIFSDSGNILARTECSYPLDIQPGGKVEQSPLDWIDAVVNCTRELAALGAPIWPPSICALTGQMHGLVLLDAEKQILRKAIICSDFRANEELAQIEASLDPTYVCRITGSPGIAMMPGPKMLWLRKNEPDLHKKIRKFLFPKDYIGFKMTGEMATDPSDASGTMFYNIVKGDWDERLCSLSAVPLEILPPVIPSDSMRGTVSKEFSTMSEIPAGIPVIAGGGDLAATMLGAGVLSENDVSVSLGTSGITARLANKLQGSVLGKIFYFSHVIPDRLISMGSCPATGFSINWFENQILKSPGGHRRKIGDIGQIDLSEPPSLFYLPFILGTGSPYMDYTSQGAFMGLSHHHQKEDLRRAILEGIAYSMRQSLELLQTGRETACQIIANAGGSYNKKWVQILANIFGQPMHTLIQKDTAVVGAAILGAFSAGYYANLEEATCDFVREEEVIDPDINAIPYYNEGYLKYIRYCELLGEIR